MSYVLKFMQITSFNSNIKTDKKISIIICYFDKDEPIGTSSSFIRAPKQRKSVGTVGHSVDIVHLAKQSEKVGESHKLIMSEVEQ